MIEWIECKSRNGKLTYMMKSHAYTEPFEVVPDNSMPFAEWYNPETGYYFDKGGMPIGHDCVLRIPSAGQGEARVPVANAFEYSESLGNVPNGRDFPLPTRATKGSAGYDIFSPYGHAVTVPAHGYAEFPLGIRCRIKPGEFLLILPRSSMGFRGRHVSLTNTAGVIDSDYYGNASNGGEISIRLFNASDEDYAIPPHGRVAQAIFLKYDLADGDSAGGSRVGGFGSTDGGVRG